MQPPLTSYLKKNNCSAFTGLSAFALGLFLLLVKTWLLEVLTSSMLLLTPNSQIATTWIKMPISVPTDVYFFNWTNPDDFYNVSTKPKFEQVGPYRFMQNMEKVNVKWNDNDTVTYNQVRTWYFNQKHTNGSLSDKITTLNAITMSASHYIRNWNYFIKKAASAFLTTVAPRVDITKTVNQFLFEGYDDRLVDVANYLPFIASEIPRFDRFGWFRMRNGSSTFDGVFNMANGANGNFEIRNWNYYNVTPYFNGSCAKVHGSGGELYSLKPTKDYIGIFVSDLCRYVRFDYETEVTVNGILGYKYTIGNGVLDNGTNIPGNECYCSGDCLPSGMINISSCRYGLPTFASLPNFYGADPVYLNQVQGLQPEKTKHEAYIILEPKTAILLEVAARLQLNILIHPIKDIGVYQNVPEIFFPLLWAEQKAAVPPHVVLMLKVFLNAPCIFVAIGVLLIVVGVYLLMFVVYKPIIFYWFKKIQEEKFECKSLEPEEIPLQT